MYFEQTNLQKPVQHVFTANALCDCGPPAASSSLLYVSRLTFARSTGPAPPTGSPVTLPVIVEETPVWCSRGKRGKRKRIPHITTTTQRVSSVCHTTVKTSTSGKNAFAKVKISVLLPGRTFSPPSENAAWRIYRLAFRRHANCPKTLKM